MYTNQDLPVGTSITFNDEGKVREDYVLGNYSSHSGEIRTSWAGMVDIAKVKSKGDDSFFLKVRAEVQRIKALLNATDKDRYEVQMLIRDFQRDASNYENNRFTSCIEEVWDKKYYKPKKKYLKVLESIDKELMEYFYMSWFEYLYNEQMPKRVGSMD